MIAKVKSPLAIEINVMIKFEPVVSSVNQFILLSTTGCHLCEVALEILDDLQQQMADLAAAQNFSLPEYGAFMVQLQDVADDDNLISIYGQRIPVLIFGPTKEELAWPFDIQQAYQFIQPKLLF